jgi:hypothetical protein
VTEQIVVEVDMMVVVIDNVVMKEVEEYHSVVLEQIVVEFQNVVL